MLGEVEESEIARDSGELYQFLDDELSAEKLAAYAPEGIERALRRLVVHHMAAGNSEPYEAIRGKYIALNRALNSIGHIAPRFRPSLSSGKFVGSRSRDQNLISNDHQVLDLEWLNHQCHYNDLYAHHVPQRWMGIFGACLNIPLASRFAGTAGSAENKAIEILELPTLAQLQLRAIQSENVRHWWRDRREKTTILGKAIRAQQSANSALRGKDSTWPNYWLAAKCAEYSGGSAAEWLNLITGSRVAPSTISGAKKRCDEMLGPAAGAIRSGEK